MKTASAHRWRWVSLIGASAFVFGCIGYRQLFLSQGWDPTASDVIYSSLSLFLFNPPEGTNLPVALDFARFAAPATTGWAFFTAALSLFKESANRIKLWRIRGHVVVCGLGFKGATFIKALRAGGYRVVAIEADAEGSLVEEHRRLGIPVVIGDAQHKETLECAKIKRAQWLLAMCPEDAVNTEIVLSARELAQERTRGDLNCLAQIGSTQLSGLLSELQVNHTAKWSVAFFNTEDIAAGLILKHHPFDTGDTPPHILVAHLDPLGQRLVVEAAQRWRTRRTGHRLIVTIVDEHAESRITKLTQQYRLLAQTCTFIACRPRASDLRDLPGRYQQDNLPAPSHAYVTAFDDEVGVASMLQLRRYLDLPFTPVLTQSRNSGVARLMGGLTPIEIFPTFEMTCATNPLVAVSVETLAQAIHEIWRVAQRAADKEDLAWNDPRAAPLRESSRAQARDIPVKLRILGYALGPAETNRPTELNLTEDELEQLAIHEHDRWNQERWDAGWTLGPKDIDAKTSPYLIPFEELPDEVAEWDRDFVRKIPQIVAAAGFSVKPL